MSRVPKRISSLPAVSQCFGFWHLRDQEPSVSGKAADTGSAAHRGAELLHRGYSPEDAATLVATEFPGADLAQAGLWVRQYALDPRNQDTVLVDTMEAEVKLTLPPDDSDPTGAAIELTGHVDQVRRGADGQLRVWDIKTGRDEGRAMTFRYGWQIAAYALAATETFGEPVLPGGIIRFRGYTRRERCDHCGAAVGADCVSKSGKWARNHAKREITLLDPETAPVFFPASWSLETCRTMLGSFAWLVAAKRRGEVLLTPGDHCTYCPAGGPHACAEQIV